MSGEVVYFELPANDVEATQRFWGSLFGWTFNPGNFPGYSMIDGPNPIGGTDSARGPLATPTDLLQCR